MGAVFRVYLQLRFAFEVYLKLRLVFEVIMETMQISLAFRISSVFSHHIIQLLGHFLSVQEQINREGDTHI